METPVKLVELSASGFELKVKAAHGTAERALNALAFLKIQMGEIEEHVNKLSGELGQWSEYKTDEAKKFLKEPWCIIPKSRDEWWVIVPRFVGLQVGWLERSTATYNLYVVNRYAHWLGNVPPELKHALQLPDPFQAIVEDGLLHTKEVLPERIRKMVSKEISAGVYKIKRGREFDMLASLIENGALPFKPHAVAKGDLIAEPVLRGPLAKLRSYQLQAWEKFLAYGAVGIFWPWGQGKTVIGCYTLAHLKGPNLVVVPTKTLREQWLERIHQWLSPAQAALVTVITYASWKHVMNQEWMGAIFDECHRLPANTFSRLASVRAKYRMGLSASPYREDGRTNYIFALSGYPVGVNWSEFLRSGQITKPTINVRIVSGWIEKCKITEAETKGVDGSVIIFCDGIAQGASLASRLGCPHVHGQTQKRLEVLRDTKIAVISRVGDEGLSIPDLRKVIEVDFHGSSRRQESQRVGRLLHSDLKGEHLVLMTQDEFDRFSGRFLALEEKGFNVTVHEAR